jgi:dephospho-CoA kinase
MHAQDWLNSTMKSMARSNDAPKRLPRIVGIAGRAGTGKDTVAGYLQRQYHYHLFRFADPLKQALQTMFGIAPEVWEDRAAKEAALPWLGVSPRYLAQTLGTDWGRRMIADDLWIRVMERRIERHRDHRIIIPDVRFDNEAALIKRHGGVVVKLFRDSAPDVLLHASEAGVSDLLCDDFIANNGTIDGLYKTAVEVLEQLASVSERTP